MFRPDKSRGLECFVVADCDGSWKDSSFNDDLSAHSWYGYVIMYKCCSIIWASKI